MSAPVEPLTVIAAALAVAARTAPTLATAPLLGHLPVPWSARGGVALALVATLTPLALVALPSPPQAIPPTLLFATILPRELAFGVLFAASTGLALHALHAASHALGRGQDAAEAPSAPLLTSGFATASFFLMDGHLLAVGALARTFGIVHPLSLAPLDDTAAHALDALPGLLTAFLAALILWTLPLAAASGLAELGEALLERFTPSLASGLRALPTRAVLAGLAIFLVLRILVDLALTDTLTTFSHLEHYLR